VASVGLKPQIARRGWWLCAIWEFSPLKPQITRAGFGLRAFCRFNTWRLRGLAHPSQAAVDVPPSPPETRTDNRVPARRYRPMCGESTIVCSSVKVCMTELPPTLPIPLSVPARPPNGRWASQ
jgi:hypothetical protein